MNFEKNKQDMLNNLNKIKREKHIAKRASSHKLTTDAQGAPAAVSKERKTVIVFGTTCFFIRNIQSTLSGGANVFHFEDPGKATDYCIDNAVNYVFLDMDEPTNWRHSTDVFTTVKTIDPKINFFLFTSRPQAVEVRTLEAQGATILEKPIAMEDVKECIV